jgi:hypothetical protein
MAGSGDTSPRESESGRTIVVTPQRDAKLRHNFASDSRARDSLKRDSGVEGDSAERDECCDCGDHNQALKA